MEQMFATGPGYAANNGGAVSSSSPGTGAGAEIERRAALLSISRLLSSPDSFGISGHLLMPHGFNLQVAEFDPLALKRSKHATQNGSSYAGSTRRPEGSPLSNSFHPSAGQLDSMNGQLDTQVWPRAGHAVSNHW